MIKAIIFDFYGVLVTEKLITFKETHFKTPEEKEKINDLLDELNMNQISRVDFRTRLAEMAGMTLEQINDMLGKNEPNEKLLDYIKNELKPRYKLGIISNAPNDSILKYLRPGDELIFDYILVSGDFGYIKPEPEIYEEALKQLGVNPGEAVFIDDIVRYCNGAERVGIKAINYKSFDQTVAVLKDTLSANLDD